MIVTKPLELDQMLIAMTLDQIPTPGQIPVQGLQDQHLLHIVALRPHKQWQLQMSFVKLSCIENVAVSGSPSLLLVMMVRAGNV